MKERGILFSAPMVRAILAGKKTQTRRIVQYEVRGPNPPNLFDVYGGNPRKWLGAFGSDGKGNALSLCPYGAVGDRLWVRETWRTAAQLDSKSPKAIAAKALDAGYSSPWAPILYEADGATDNWERDTWGETGKTRVSIHMPRWASRITLEVTGVRVERLQEISGDDAVAEGIDPNPHRCGCEYCSRTMEMCPAMATGCIEEYATLWESINGKRAPWDSNPWVWVVSFRRLVNAKERAA